MLWKISKADRFHAALWILYILQKRAQLDSAEQGKPLIYEYSYGPRIFNYERSKDQINDFVIPLLKEGYD